MIMRELHPNVFTLYDLTLETIKTAEQYFQSDNDPTETLIAAKLAYVGSPPGVRDSAPSEEDRIFHLDGRSTGDPRVLVVKIKILHERKYEQWTLCTCILPSTEKRIREALYKAIQQKSFSTGATCDYGDCPWYYFVAKKA